VRICVPAIEFKRWTQVEPGRMVEKRFRTALKDLT
jgi:hypothetical protein